MLSNYCKWVHYLCERINIWNCFRYGSLRIFNFNYKPSQALLFFDYFAFLYFNQTNIIFLMLIFKNIVSRCPVFYNSSIKTSRRHPSMYSTLCSPSVAFYSFSRFEWRRGLRAADSDDSHFWCFCSAVRAAAHFIH